MQKKPANKKPAVSSHKQMNLFWSEGVRAFLCMLPMLVAGAFGKISFLVALGQGGFFFSSLFLPVKPRARIIMGSILIALGLGFYLIGGTIAPTAWIAILFTFFVCLNLSFLSSWRIGGPLALTLVMIFTAGLNTGSAQKAANNFLLFAFVMAWSTIISLPPVWQPIPQPKVDDTLTDLDYAEQGIRMGIGASIALSVSYIFGFSKLGWAPSAVGNVVRFDKNISRLRAWDRLAGTFGGAILAILVLGFITNPTVVVYFGGLFAVFNGLFKKTKLGTIPFFYTATILLLYSANDIVNGNKVAFERFVYNVIGILIGVIVVVYPFPAIMRRLRETET